MKIDHLVAYIDGTRLRILGHLQSESAIEDKHWFGVLHGKSDMIEASDPARLLRPSGGSAGEKVGCRACGDHALDEPPSGQVMAGSPNGFCACHGLLARIFYSRIGGVERNRDAIACAFEGLHAMFQPGGEDHEVARGG